MRAARVAGSSPRSWSDVSCVPGDRTRRIQLPGNQLVAVGYQGSDGPDEREVTDEVIDMDEVQNEWSSEPAEPQSSKRRSPSRAHTAARSSNDGLGQLWVRPWGWLLAAIVLAVVLVIVLGGNDVNPPTTECTWTQSDHAPNEDTTVTVVSRLFTYRVLANEGGEMHIWRLSTAPENSVWEWCGIRVRSGG